MEIANELKLIEDLDSTTEITPNDLLIVQQPEGGTKKILYSDLSNKLKQDLSQNPSETVGGIRYEELTENQTVLAGETIYVDVKLNISLVSPYTNVPVLGMLKFGVDHTSPTSDNYCLFSVPLLYYQISGEQGYMKGGSMIRVPMIFISNNIATSYMIVGSNSNASPNYTVTNTNYVIYKVK